MTTFFATAPYRVLRLKTTRWWQWTQFGKFMKTPKIGRNVCRSVYRQNTISMLSENDAGINLHF